MAIKPRAKGIPRFTAYSALSAFAAFVISSLTTNVAFYATPAPSVIALTAQLALLDAAISAWGVVGGRGSHVQLMALRSAAFTMRNMLVQELGYVMNTVIAAGGDYATQASNVVLSGFGVKNPGTPQGLLNQPENLHQFFKNSISIYHVGLKWNPPIGVTSPGNVHNYQIYRGLTNSFTDPSTLIIGTSTKGLFIDSAVPPAAAALYYFVTASNNFGAGSPTASLPVAPIY